MNRIGIYVSLTCGGHSSWNQTEMRHSISRNMLAGLLIVAPVWVTSQVAAGDPGGLAGRAQSISQLANFPSGTGQYFEWYQYFGEHRLEAGEQLELSFAIIPFDDAGLGATHVLLQSNGGGTFVVLNFQAGLLNEKLSYNLKNWNSVTALLDFSSQSYSLTMNGAKAGPFRFNVPSESVQAFQVYYTGAGKLGWFDSVMLSAAGAILLHVDFDDSLPGAQSLCQGCLLIPVEPGDNSVPLCCTNTIRPPSRQDGLAGRAETTFNVGISGQQYFEWYQPFGARRLDSGEQVELSFYLLPFTGEGAGATLVGLDDGEGAASFFWMNFQNGLVNGKLAYNPTNWNSVKASLDFATQSYELVVNGVGLKAIPFQHPSNSMRAFRVDYLRPGFTPAVAWFDSVTLTSGTERVFSFDFDRSRPGPQNLCEPCKMTAEDPVTTGSSSQGSIPDGPRLTAQKTDDGISLSWASGNTPSVLQVSQSLAGTWRDVLEPSRTEGHSSVVRIQAPPSPAFFRLIAPRNP